MSEIKNPTVYEDAKLEPIKPKKIKEGVKIQYVNQDLQEAIKEVKLHFKNHKDHRPAKETKNKNNPENNFHTTNEHENSRLLFTENYKKKYESRLQQIDEKRKEIIAKSLDKQMKARLQRKIKENYELRDKMDLLKDIQERRESLITERKLIEKQKSQEKQLLHESSIDKVKMLRKIKNKQKKKEIKESRVVEQESFKDLQFRRYIENKQSQDRHVLLKTKHDFMIRSQSTTGLRKLMTERGKRGGKQSFSTANLHSRTIKTSQGARTNRGATNREEEQELEIMRKYDPKNSRNQECDEKSEGKSQKRYNQGVRTNQEGGKIEEKVHYSEERDSNGVNHLFNNGKLQQTPLEIDEEINGNNS